MPDTPEVTTEELAIGMDCLAFEWRQLGVMKFGQATDEAAARLRALEAENKRLRDALMDIAQSGPVDTTGQPDPYAGWSWCYDRATTALKGA